MLALAALLAALDACGAPTGPAALPAPPVAAPAPPVTVTPAGQVLTLHAERPEGVAVDASSGRLVVDTQDQTLLVLTAAGVLVRTVALPGSGRHVRRRHCCARALRGHRAAGQRSRRHRGVVRSVTVGSAPHDVTLIPGDRAVVEDEADGTVSVVGLGSGCGVQTLPAGLQPGAGGRIGEAGRGPR